MTYRKSVSMEEFDRIIEQLDHAVERCGGKTTITKTDICIMRAVSGALEYYGRMASRN